MAGTPDQTSTAGGQPEFYVRLERLHRLLDSGPFEADLESPQQLIDEATRILDAAELRREAIRHGAAASRRSAGANSHWLQLRNALFWALLMEADELTHARRRKRLEEFNRETGGVFELESDIERWLVSLRDYRTAINRIERIIGRSPAMRELKDRIWRSRFTDSFSQYRDLHHRGLSGYNVIIQGETGTGKELVADAIGQDIPVRAEGAHFRPYVKVNIAEFPEELAASELFGHVRGSFTGAMADRRGLVEEADGGTIFLDEIGDASLPTQIKLLRTIQEGKVRPVGANLSADVQVRVLAATNKDLYAEILAERFRQDLYFRLASMIIRVPPLRDRREDIPLIVDFYLNQKFGEGSVFLEELREKVHGRLERFHVHQWPGNVRQLLNIVDTVIMGEEINPKVEIGVTPRDAQVRTFRQFFGGEYISLERLQTAYLKEVLAREPNNTHAGRILGIDRNTVGRKRTELFNGNEDDQAEE